jgi:FixJ family two-component response regulator
MSLQGAREADIAPPRPTIVIVDDDDDLRETLAILLQSVGMDVISHPSTRSFLEDGIPPHANCLVLDVRMPGGSGLELQEKLVALGTRLPIVFITGHADVPMTVRAMKSGAINFLSKPFRDQELLDAIWEAIRIEGERRASERGRDQLRKLAETLTPREVDVLRALDRGLLNKQIAFELGIAEITVKMHRSNAFRKLRATTVPDMIQKVRELNLGQSQSG